MSQSGESRETRSNHDMALCHVGSDILQVAVFQNELKHSPSLEGGKDPVSLGMGPPPKVKGLGTMNISTGGFHAKREKNGIAQSGRVTPPPPVLVHHSSPAPDEPLQTAPSRKEKKEKKDRRHVKNRIRNPNFIPGSCRPGRCTPSMGTQPDRPGTYANSNPPSTETPTIWTSATPGPPAPDAAITAQITQGYNPPPRTGTLGRTRWTKPRNGTRRNAQTTISTGNRKGMISFASDKKTAMARTCSSKSWT